MRPLAVLLLVIAAESAAYAVAPFVMLLDNVKPGELPQGWSATKTGDGPGSVWKVVADTDGKKVLAQTSDQGPNRLFNLCVAENSSFRDIDVTVAFKAVAGKLDQGGGPVWRYRDANNYYVARMNPLEDNYRLYKVVGGKRMQLASADVKAAAGQWHTLRIVHKGDHIECYLNGKPYLDVKDDTFTDAGKIGLWTKADAQTHFANLRASEPAQVTASQQTDSRTSGVSGDGDADGLVSANVRYLFQMSGRGLVLQEYKDAAPEQKALLDRLTAANDAFPLTTAKAEGAIIPQKNGIKLLSVRAEIDLLKSKIESRLIDLLGVDLKLQRIPLIEWRAKHLEGEVALTEWLLKQVKEEPKGNGLEGSLRQAERDKEQWTKLFDRLSQITKPADAVALLKEHDKQARKNLERAYARLINRT